MLQWGGICSLPIHAEIPAADGQGEIPAIEHMTEPVGENRTFSDVTPADQGNRPTDRVYYLVCLCCRSRLAVTARLAGQACKCPTCGIGFAVPDALKFQASEGEPVAVGEMLEERVAPHAYAAAGEMAPEVLEEPSGRAMIRCRRCGTISEIDTSSCRSCGVPFTIEAGSVEPAFPVNGWAIASLVLGIVSLGTFVPVIAAAAIMTGLVGLRRLYVQYSGAQRVTAFSGMVLGGLSIVAHVVRFLI